MNTLFSEGKTIWILEENSDMVGMYREILDLRYDTSFYRSLDELVAQLGKISIKKPDLIIAELKVGKDNIMKFLPKLREGEFSCIPFMVISGVQDLDAIRFCFDNGVTDYLVKPVVKNEVLIKVENALVGRGSAIIGMERRELSLDGVKIDNLTSKQIQVLALFLNSPSRVVNRTDILDKVWGNTTVHPKTVDVHLYNLRRKLQDYGYLIRSEGGGRWVLLSNRAADFSQTL